MGLLSNLYKSQFKGKRTGPQDPLDNVDFGNNNL